MSEKGNGHLSLRTFLMIAGITLTLMLWVASMFAARTVAIETNIDKIQDSMAGRGERLTAVEEQTKNIEKFIVDQKDFNKRLEAKIDSLLRR